MIDPHATTVSQPATMLPATARRAAPTDRLEHRMISKARAGDSVAEARLLRRYERAVNAIVADFFAPWLERADLVQAGRLALWGAITDWDPTRAPFARFVSLRVRSAVGDAVESARRRKHEIVSTATSLHAPTTSGADGDAGLPLADRLADRAGRFGDPHEVVVVHDELRDIRLRLSLLSERERECVALVADGHSRAEVVARVGGNGKSVDNALQRGRRKLSGAEDAARPRFASPSARPLSSPDDGSRPSR